MNHPSREEWMAYLYGELPRKSKAVLGEHLRLCAACQSDLAIWQSAKHKLAAWKLNWPRHGIPSPVVYSVFKWAMAALVILGLGFTIGRFAQTRADAQSLRSALAPELKAALLPELRKEMQQQLAADCRAVLAGGPETADTTFRRELRALLDENRAKALASAQARNERALLEFAESYRADREQAQQGLVALLDRSERRHQAELLNLRRAVETVAVVADDKFQRTETQLGQLASYAQAQPISSPAQPVR